MVTIKNITCILILLPALLLSQSNSVYRLTVSFNHTLIKKINYRKEHPNAASVKKEINKIFIFLYNKSFLEAKLDSTVTIQNNYTVYINPGNEYKWGKITVSEKDEFLLKSIGIQEKYFTNKKITYRSIAKTINKILIWHENNGYPFADVRIDSVSISNNIVNGKLTLNRNELIKIDSIVVKGNNQISEKYISAYINIKQGSLYNETKIKSITPKIKELPYLKQLKPLEVLFIDDRCKIILTLDKKKTSRFDGILGLQPDNNTGKIVATGDIKIKLLNSFNRGELIEFNWRRINILTQDLKSKTSIPYLFNTPFGTDLSFKLYKKDTTFLEVNPVIGLRYQIGGSNYLKVSYNNKKLSLLSSKHLAYLTSLPAYADVNNTLYTLGFYSSRLDYRFNPRKGFEAEADFGAGTKTIKKNKDVNPLVYDKINLHSASYQFEARIDVFIPIFKRSTIKAGVQSGSVYSEHIFSNELMRIGGANSLRGFDQESIRASTFCIVSTEYRFLPEENTNFFIFGDFAWYESNSVESYVNDFPIGFGAGVNFQTKAGIFNLSYGLGKQFNNPIYLRSGKIHFGLTNYF